VSIFEARLGTLFVHAVSLANNPLAFEDVRMSYSSVGDAAPDLMDEYFILGDGLLEPPLPARRSADELALEGLIRSLDIGNDSGALCNLARGEEMALGEMTIGDEYLDAGVVLLVECLLLEWSSLN
jgi:hypothetical protein